MVNDRLVEGLLLGLAGSAGVGFFARRILLAMRPVRGFFKAPVMAQKTPPSPAQAAMGCARGVIILIFWFGLLAGVIVVWLSGRVRVQIL